MKIRVKLEKKSWKTADEFEEEGGRKEEAGDKRRGGNQRKDGKIKRRRDSDNCITDRYVICLLEYSFISPSLEAQHQTVTLQSYWEERQILVCFYLKYEN